jgi:hypothetical protein
MNTHPIQFTIELESDVDFEMLLQNFFSRNKSPIRPICVTSKWTYKNKPPRSGLVEITRYNHRVVEATTDPNEPDKELAQIRIDSAPSFVLVFFEECGASERDWKKVEKLAQEIFIKAKELKYEISVDPKTIMPKRYSKPWEEVEDHYFDRTIVELWWGGNTNSEIGKKIHREPRTVTNILSRLRGKYKEEIVPTDEQRRKILLKNL